MMNFYQQTYPPETASNLPGLSQQRDLPQCYKCIHVRFTHDKWTGSYVACFLFFSIFNNFLSNIHAHSHIDVHQRIWGQHLVQGYLACTLEQPGIELPSFRLTDDLLLTYSHVLYSDFCLTFEDSQIPIHIQIQSNLTDV